MRLNLCIDRRYRVPRIWSNRELSKFAPLFRGRVINVSGWQDEDKEGGRYRDYFVNALEYYVSNIEGYMGLSGLDNEIYLDLERDLPKELENGFDVVFCHTVLEHVFGVEKAFDNLCKLSKDIVIMVVPFVQQQHVTADFGDYWRFTPQGVIQNFQKRGFDTLYLSLTPHKRASTYIFSIASCNPRKWENMIERSISVGTVPYIDQPFYCKIIYKIYVAFGKILGSFKKVRLWFPFDKPPGICQSKKRCQQFSDNRTQKTKYWDERS